MSCTVEQFHALIIQPLTTVVHYVSGTGRTSPQAEQHRKEEDLGRLSVRGRVCNA